MNSGLLWTWGVIQNGKARTSPQEFIIYLWEEVKYTYMKKKNKKVTDTKPSNSYPCLLRWVSYRQHMCGSCFIHSASLCLLIGAFNPFTFKIIIDRCLFIDISPLCTCVPLSLTLFLHLLKAVPLASCQAGLVEVYCVSLLLSGKLLIWPSILIESLGG